MSITVASVEKINALKMGIEATTGESYNDLTEAVQGLKNGYGQSGGEVGKPYIDSSKMTNFNNFISNNPLLIDELDKLDTSNGTNFSNMFQNVKNIEVIPPLNTINGSRFDYMFYSSGVKEIQSLNLSKAQYMSSTFTNCSTLETINIVGTCDNISSNIVLEFSSAIKLKNITIPQGWKNSIYIEKSTEYSTECLHRLIENLADLTGETAKTFRIGTTNLAKIDETHLTMLETKNWAYS